MSHKQKVAVVVAYAVLLAAGIAWAQAEAEAMGVLRSWGEGVLLLLAILGSIGTGFALWYRLDYRVQDNKRCIGEIRDSMKEHREYHEKRDTEFSELMRDVRTGLHEMLDRRP